MKALEYGLLILIAFILTYLIVNPIVDSVSASLNSSAELISHAGQ